MILPKLSIPTITGFLATKAGIAATSAVVILATATVGTITYVNLNAEKAPQQEQIAQVKQVEVTATPTEIVVTVTDTPSPTNTPVATATPTIVSTPIPTKKPVITSTPTQAPVSNAPSATLKQVKTVGGNAAMKMNIPSNWTMTSVLNSDCAGMGMAEGDPITCVEVTIKGVRGEFIEFAVASLKYTEEFAFSGVTYSGTTVDSSVNIYLPGTKASNNYDRYVKKNASGQVINFYIENGNKFAVSAIPLCMCSYTHMVARGGTTNNTYLQADSLTAINQVLSSIKYAN